MLAVGNCPGSDSKLFFQTDEDVGDFKGIFICSLISSMQIEGSGWLVLSLVLSLVIGILFEISFLELVYEGFRISLVVCLYILMLTLSFLYYVWGLNLCLKIFLFHYIHSASDCNLCPIHVNYFIGGSISFEVSRQLDKYLREVQSQAVEGSYRWRRL